MTPARIASLAAASAIALVLTAGCNGNASSDSGGEPGAPTVSKSGKLVFSDDFEDGQLGPDWVEGKGENGPGSWRIKDGMVEGVDIHNDPLWLEQELPDKVRVEFDIVALSPVGDLKVEVFGDGLNHESGYILIFGGWKNSLDVIARLDEHGKDRKARKTQGVMPGHVYHWAIERTGSTLNWYVDGEHFMSYEDSQPLTGEGHRHFAFNIWSAPVHYDNVRVYDLSQ